MPAVKYLPVVDREHVTPMETEIHEGYRKDHRSSKRAYEGLPIY